MRRSSNRRSFFQESSEELINMTPLLDVLFVVLVMFILIAPLLEVDRIQLAEKGASTTPQEELLGGARSIKIYVREDNSIFLGKEALSLKQLTSLLHEIHKQYPHERPQLYQDQKATFGTFQQIKNAVESAGFDEMDILLKHE